MKFTSNGLSLAEAVLKVSKACAVRTTAPVMECIKIGAKGDTVSLLATDGELSIEKTIKAEVLEEGAVCVPGKLFTDFIGKLSGEEVCVTTGERGVEIKYRDSGSYMQAISAEEFPEINLTVGEDSFVLKQGDFKKIVAKTAFCCAQDDSRPVLKGCLMEFKDKLEMTALDGFRLALSETAVISKSGEKNIICPARTLNEIARMLPGEDEEVHGMELKFIGKHAMFNVTTALPQAVSEIERMGVMALKNLQRAMDALLNKNEKALKEVYQKEDIIDYLNTEISNYLVKINQLSLPIQDRKQLGTMFHVVNDIERIGDHAENIADYAKTLMSANLKFTKKAQNELKQMFDLVTMMLNYSLEMFVTGDDSHANDILQFEKEIDKMEKKLQKKHINRLTNNKCEPHAAMIFSDLLSNLERVADHGTNIAFAEQDEEEE